MKKSKENNILNNNKSQQTKKINENKIITEPLKLKILIILK